VTLDVYESAYLTVTSASSHVLIDRCAYLEKIEALRQFLLPLLDVVNIALLAQHSRPFRLICPFLSEVLDVHKFPLHKQ
jgi:hypothetical protein